MGSQGVDRKQEILFFSKQEVGIIDFFFVPATECKMVAIR